METVVTAPERATRRELEWELNRRGVSVRWLGRGLMEVWKAGAVPNTLILYYRVSERDGKVGAIVTGKKLILGEEGIEFTKDLNLDPEDATIWGNPKEVAEDVAYVVNFLQEFVDGLLEEEA